MALDGTKFTADEQSLLTNLPAIVGTAMTLAGGSGLGTVKEMIANSKAFLEGGKLFPNNSLIAGILPNMQNFGEAMGQSKELRESLRAHLEQHAVKTNDELRQLALDDAKQVNGILAAKASPDDATGYKNWILNIADEVAKAAKEGGFLGFGGQLVSSGESALFAAVANALNVQRTI